MQHNKIRYFKVKDKGHYKDETGKKWYCVGRNEKEAKLYLKCQYPGCHGIAWGYNKGYLVRRKPCEQEVHDLVNNHKYDRWWENKKVDLNQEEIKEIHRQKTIKLRNAQIPQTELETTNLVQQHQTESSHISSPQSQENLQIKINRKNISATSPTHTAPISINKNKPKQKPKPRQIPTPLQRTQSQTPPPPPAPIPIPSASFSISRPSIPVAPVASPSPIPNPSPSPTSISPSISTSQYQTYLDLQINNQKLMLTLLEKVSDLTKSQLNNLKSLCKDRILSMNLPAILNIFDSCIDSLHTYDKNSNANSNKNYKKRASKYERKVEEEIADMNDDTAESIAINTPSSNMTNVVILEAECEEVCEQEQFNIHTKSQTSNKEGFYLSNQSHSNASDDDEYEI